MRVNEVVVISLPERSARRERLLASLPRPWPFPAPRIHPGVREDPPPFWLSSAGAWGCRQAHLQVLRSAWERSIETTLVLEDDAVFAPAFADRWAVIGSRIPANWSMVMLGGQHIVTPARTGTHLVRCVNTRRTHAYVIHLKAIPYLVRTWAGARRHIDHSLASFQQAAHVYAPTHFLIGQDAGFSDISAKDNPVVRFWVGPDETPPGLEWTGTNGTDTRTHV